MIVEVPMFLDQTASDTMDAAFERLARAEHARRGDAIEVKKVATFFATDGWPMVRFHLSILRNAF